MSKILCIETATTNCSVAIGDNGNLVAFKEDYNNSFSHAERLHTFIEEVLIEANLKLNELDAIAVSKGPGSYTGLRIGVSAAKGLCYTLNKPLISVPTLESLAHQVDANTTVISMLDARRMEVYVAGFNESREQILPTQAKILDENSFITILDTSITYFIGSGVEKFKAICTHQNARFIENKLPSAKDMITLATSKYKISDIEDVAYFEPFYLKDFMAG